MSIQVIMCGIAVSAFVALSEAEACDERAVVGVCMLTGCYAGFHGPAHCEQTQCFCDPGFCSRDGQWCVPVPRTTTTSTPPTTTSTTSTTNTTTTTSTTNTTTIIATTSSAPSFLNTQCEPEAVVGTCRITGCWEWDYGWSHCEDDKCVCDAGYCSTDGKTCVPQTTPTTPNVGTCQSDAVVGTCWLTGCWTWDYGWSHCQDGKCICDEGYCSFDGKTCVGENSMDIMLSADDRSPWDSPTMYFAAVFLASVSGAVTAVMVTVRRDRRSQLAEPLVHEQ